MTTIAGGTGIIDLVNQWLNAAAGNQQNLYTLAGYYDPYALGWASTPGSILPTLGRDQFNASNAIAQGDLTGTFNGQPTLANQQLQAQIAQWGTQNALQGRQLDAQIAQWAQQNALDAGSLTGFYNGLPTLAREQLAATIGIANAQQFTQWAQMRGSQLLQQQAQDDAMRQAAAQSQLSTLGLLAQQKGPQNFLAYNYLENALGSPDLAARDPFQIAHGLLQGVPARTPVDLNSAWNTPPPAGTQVAMPNMTAPAGAPRAPAGGGGSSSPAPATTPTSANRVTTPRAVAPPSQSGLAISGNPQADAALAASPAWAGASPEIMAEFNRISGNMANTYANAKAKNPNFQLYANGTPEGTIDWGKYLGPGEHGMRNDQAFVAGDVKRAGDPNPEMLVNPTGAPFGIVPMDEMSRGDRLKAGVRDMNAPANGYAEGTGFDWASMFSGANGNPLQAFADWARNFADQPQRGYTYNEDGSIQNYVSPYHHHQQNPPSQPSIPPGETPAPATPPVSTGGTQQPYDGPTYQQNGRRMGTPFGDIYTNPNDSYWGRLPGDFSQTQGRLPAFATGTFSTDTPFGDFGTFTPDQLAQSPLVKKLNGQSPSSLWQHFGGADTMTIPGTQTRLPNTINMASFARMAPSERAMTEGIYSTPRSMGGLGLSWDDIMNASMRAAPIGARFSSAGYGY